MQTIDVVKWNKRMSFMYAIGVWTLMGAFGFYTLGYYDKKPELETDERKKKDEEKPTNPNRVVYSTAYSTTTIVYKENFVPYSTRLMNLIKSAFGDSTSEGQDSKK